MKPFTLIKRLILQITLLSIICLPSATTLAATHKVEELNVLPLNWHIQNLIANRHGELLSWSEVDTLIPRKSIFEVIDYETGLSFKVQRRAGSKHADVQPLTFTDTKIMKVIYDGEWKWHRRAILIHQDGRLLAASMHGMPHGRGALKNGFPGHFCIHFKGSTTHQTRHLDPTHQVMVYKAAGKLDAYINHADPYILVDLFIMALNQQDEELLGKVVRNDSLAGAITWKNRMKNITGITRTSLFDFEEVQSQLAVSIPIKARVYWENQGKETISFNFVVKRNGLYEPWKIELE